MYQGGSLDSLDNGVIVIDICMVIYRNYALLTRQFEHWKWLEGEHRFLVCDNTPAAERQAIVLPPPHQLFVQEFQGIDGTTHGGALDLLVRQATSPIVGICDSDFFWVKKDILAEVQSHFHQGKQAVGAELWYCDFGYVNEMYPDRAGWLAPCVFGMFLDRRLALSETFVTTPPEGVCLKMETGWRMRKKMIDEKVPRHVYRAFHYPNQGDPQVEYFGTPEDPVGVHLLKGSSFRAAEMNRMERLIQLGINKGVENVSVEPLSQ